MCLLAGSAAAVWADVVSGCCSIISLKCLDRFEFCSDLPLWFARNEMDVLFIRLFSH